MIAVIAPVRAFFLIYLPATALIGLVVGVFQAPGMERNVAYELFLWFVVAVQLVLPTLAIYLSVWFCLKKIPMKIKPDQKWVTGVVVMALTLPVSQALLWGGHALSMEWFLVAVVPAALLSIIVFRPVSRH